MTEEKPRGKQSPDPTAPSLTGKIGQSTDTLKLKMSDAFKLSDLSTTDLVMLLDMVSVELKVRHGMIGTPHNRTDLIATNVPNLRFEDVTGIDDKDFKVLPQRLAESDITHENSWKFVLVSPDKSLSPIAVQAVGDVIIGRSEEGVTPDLDLTSHQQNAQRSISRVHAVIRPGEKQITLTDLGSTNGTYIDGEKLVAGRPITLRDRATITLGTTHLQIQIIEKPEAKPQD